jgi:hypothetical protein
MSWGWWISAVLSALAFIGGLTHAYWQHRWLSRAKFTEGKVVELLTQRDSKGKTTYKPRIRFASADGRSTTFDASFSSNPAPYQVGDQVSVAYDPATLSASVATFGAAFGPAVVLICLGVFGGLLTAGFVLGPRYVPAAYMQRPN